MVRQRATTRSTEPGGAAYTELVYSRGRSTVEAALRWDRWDQEGEELDQLNPRVGWRLVGEQKPWWLRASYGQAFKLPSFFATSSPRALGGNPALEPEEAESADLAIGYSHASLDLSLGVFWSDYDDLIDFDFDRFQNVNRDRVRARGVEASAAWRVTDRLRLTARATVQEVEDVALDEDLLDRPEHYGDIGLSWQAGRATTVSIDLAAIGRILDRQLPAPVRTQVDAHELLGATVEWLASERWSLRVRADNLSDQDYETRIGFPGPGLSGRVGVRYRWRSR